MLSNFDKKQCNSEACKSDCYDKTLSQCIEFLIEGRCERISSMENANLQKTQLLKLKKIAKTFTVKRCSFGSDHLWFEDQRVLMVREAYQFIQKIHGDEHLPGGKMIAKVRQFSVYLPPLFDFINQFQSYCSVCLAKGIKPVKCMSSLWRILETKFYINLKRTSKEQSINDLLANIQVEFCKKNTCTNDQYDRDNQICVFFLINDRFPPLPKGEGANSNRRRLKKKATLLRVQKCNQGSLHLWVKGHDTRIPMKKEAEDLARILHGDRAHRCKRVMMEIISQQKKIYYHEVEDAIKKIVNQCVYCNPKTADPQEDDDSSDSQGYLRNFAYKGKNVPLGRMGKAQRTECARQIMQREGLRQKFGRIKAILDKVTIWQDPKDYIKQIIKSENVSELAAEIAIENLHWSRGEDEDLDQTLNGIPELIYRTYREDNIKKVIFVCTKTMRYHYLKYGDSLCIDYVSGALRSREASGRHFLIGFFTGQNAQGKLVLFGITLISTQLSLYHMKSFQLFFSAMGGQHLPGAIITPDSRPLYLSLDIIKSKHNYQYDNYMSWFYVLEYLKKNSANQLEKQKILNMFCQSMTEPVHARYCEIMHSIRSQMVSTTVYKQIERFGEKFCICRIRPKFVGFGLSTQRVQNLYEILQKNLMYQSKISNFFSNIFQVQKYLWNNFNLAPNQQANKQCNKFKQLQKFTQILHPKMFEQLQNNLIYSNQHLTIKQAQKGQIANPSIIKIEDKLVRCIFTLKYFCIDECWKCNCNLLHFTGIPCSHLLKVILTNEGEIQYYLNSRWICAESDYQYSQLYENRGLATEYKRQTVSYYDDPKIEDPYYQDHMYEENWHDEPKIKEKQELYNYSFDESSVNDYQSSSYSRVSMASDYRSSKKYKSRRAFDQSRSQSRGRNKQSDTNSQTVPRFRSLYDQAIGQQINIIDQKSDDNGQEDHPEETIYQKIEKKIQREHKNMYDQFQGQDFGNANAMDEQKPNDMTQNVIKEEAKDINYNQQSIEHQPPAFLQPIDHPIQILPPNETNIIKQQELIICKEERIEQNQPPKEHSAQQQEESKMDQEIKQI